MQRGNTNAWDVRAESLAEQLKVPLVREPLAVEWNALLDGRGDLCDVLALLAHHLPGAPGELDHAGNKE